jgi:cytochrome c oxidase subunit 3
MQSTSSVHSPSATAEHHGHDHDPNLAHHFESHAQQLSAGKLGMWLFLVQEILFFSGLFCAYAIYRANHPEIFAYADHFLDRKLGAINTAILIFSSFTMAWAVRAVQLRQKQLATALLAITVACACGFLGIKYVEYHHKFHDGLLWGRHYKPTAEALESVRESGEAAGDALAGSKSVGTDLHAAADATHAEGSYRPPAVSTNGAADPRVSEQAKRMGAPNNVHPDEPPASAASFHAPRNVHIFFGIYFAMTGLHAIHIIAGIGVIIWMIVRLRRGDFDTGYYGPVEYTGLYWHLVDLVWIYLFPLLYLIH